MLSLTNIWNVARVEAKTLWRSWFFRVFAALAVGVVVIIDTSIFALHQADRPWMYRGIPSGLPYSNLLLLNIAQAVIAIFLASDFLKRDRKLDTTEVVYVRCMTNGDYVFGKSLGVLLVFFGLNLAVLLISLVYNVFFVDVPVQWDAYLWYPLLISIPTLLFILGLSFVVMSLVQNQPVTFVLLLGYIALTLFYLSRKLYGVFDYIAFYTPLLYSDFVGFGGLASVLPQRGAHACLGLSGILVTVTMLRRLPQSTTMQWFARVGAVVFAIGGFGLGAAFVAGHRAEQGLRQRALKLNRQVFSEPIPKMEACDLRVDARGGRLRAEARVLLRNVTDRPLLSYLFRLNPGLDVLSVRGGSGDLRYERELHLLRIRPVRPLEPGESDSLLIQYAGRIDESLCYLDVPEEERQRPFRYFLYTVRKRYAFVEPNFVVLTPESMWYPQPGGGYDAAHPEVGRRQFTRYRLVVEADTSLVPISQGKVEVLGPGLTRFIPEKPLTGVSLILGRYRIRSMQLDTLEIRLSHMPGHDYFVRHLDQVADTLDAIIRDARESYEADVGLYYLFPRLQLVEVPVQFFSYPRVWTQARETVQPEMVLLPEKAVLIPSADFEAFRRRMQRFRRFRNVTFTEKEIQTRMLQEFIRNTFLVGRPARFRFGAEPEEVRGAYLIFPNYLSYTHNLVSDRWPIFQAALEAYFSSLAVPPEFGGFRVFEGITDEERVHIALTERSFQELLRDPEFRDLVDELVKEEGEHLLYVLMGRIGPDDLADFLYTWIDNHAFRDVDVSEFVEDIRREFGFDLASFLDDWLRSRDLPAFLISPIEAYAVLDQGFTRYQVKFRITNVEQTAGVVRASFRLGGRGFGFGMMGGAEQVEQLVYLEGGQTKEVGVVLDGQPRMLTLETFISHNLPSTLTFPMGELELNPRAVPFDGERVVDEPVQTDLPGEFVVDNEDAGFHVEEAETRSLLRRLLRREREDEKYVGFRFWSPPTSWRATIGAEYFGRIVRSAHFVRAGSGDKKVSWTAELPENGYYEVFAYVPQMMRMRGPGRRGRRFLRDLHFFVRQGSENEEIEVDAGGSEVGWTSLGTFYFNAGPATVELTNQSGGRVVIADAVKWVRR